MVLDAVYNGKIKELKPQDQYSAPPSTVTNDAYGDEINLIYDNYQSTQRINRR